MKNHTIVLLLATFATACSGTIPNGYTVADEISDMKGRTKHLGFINQDTIGNETNRCVGRINGMISKAHTTRGVGAGLQFGGGLITVASGSYAAFVTDDESRQKVGAGIAAAGGVLALLPPLLANFAAINSEAYEKQKLYDEAKALFESTETEDFALPDGPRPIQKWIQKADQARAKLRDCAK